MSKADREELAAVVTDLAQAALTALETAELLTSATERKGMMDEAVAAVLNIVATVRGFAGLPDKRRN